MATLSSPATDADPVQQTITAVVRGAALNAPRSQQSAIGPSEIGDECTRRVAYRLLDLAPANPGGDPWPSIVGTAVHAWLADAFEAHNNVLHRRRWLVENRVFLTDGISGTCDLYDTDTRTVIDHKVLGTTSLKKVKVEGPPSRYRTQLHLYGYGYERAGIAVERVALTCFPRGGYLDGLHVWSEPYEPAIAEHALNRLGNLTTATYALKLDDPENPLWAQIPNHPGPGCAWCPMWRPGQPSSTAGCSGEPERTEP
jgi:hypothetical protein